MRVLFVLLLSVPAWSRHIIEGPIGEISEATEVVARADRELADPQTTPERRAEAQAARSGGVERISSVAASHPVNAEVNIAAASNLVRVNEPVRAEQAAERAVIAAPQNPDGFLHRGQARMAQGKFEDAVKDFQAVLQRRPGDPVATAGLKLSEGRGSAVTAPVPPPNAGASASNVQAPSTPAPATMPGISEFDRKAAEKRRVQDESLALYNASKIAQADANWKEALDSATKALALTPDSRFLQQHYQSIVAAQDAAAKKKQAPAPPVRPAEEAKPLGASNFIGGLLHYMGKSEKPRRINFHAVDTSSIKVTDFPAVAAELRKPPRDARIQISTKMGWTAKGSQIFMMGRGRILLRGELTIHQDCRWSFEGYIRAFDDYYDFEESDRGFILESLTAVGRALPGKRYDVEIRGSKPIRDGGTKENCP